jgi:hypothetical protein
MRSLIILVFMAVMLASCSAANQPGIPNLPGNQVPCTMSQQSISSALIGSYDFVLNPDSMTAQLISQRIGSIGESYIVNGISYFTIAPCSDCLTIKSIALSDDNRIELVFSIRHPFKPGDILKPPSAVNRLDLDIFDVALLVKPSDTSPSQFPLIASTAYTGVLGNPDGYTGEISEVLDDQSAIPYVLVVDDNDAETDTFNEFPMGAESEFSVIFNITGNVNFSLYLTMGYGASAKKPQRLMPTYYNPEFNRKSAWKVVVTPPNGIDPPVMGNTWNDSDSSTPFDVTVEVFDWQIGANVDPELTLPTDIYAASGVSKVSIEIPGMHGSIVESTTPTQGTGTPSDPLVYILSVVNENLLDAGEYTGLVKVSDERVPGIVVIGGEPDTLADSPNGVILNWLNITEFATYQSFTATVVIGCGPITGSITSPDCPLTGINSGQSIDFSAAASSGNGGDPVVLYEWDMDYDGIPSHFNVDQTGTDVTLGPFVNPNCGIPPENPVTYTIAVRATDSCNPPNVTVFDTCEVTVDTCELASVGNIILTVNRLGQTNKWVIDEFGPFTLEWTDPGVGYAEYAVYVDIDPSDGLTNNLQFSGTTNALSYTDSTTSFPTNHYVAGWTYIVRGRTQAGNPLSEGLDSEPAFVSFNGWETLNNYDNPGYNGNNGEGWLVNHETSVTGQINGLHFPRICSEWVAYPAHGTYSLQYSPWCGYQYMDAAGRWNGILKQTPIVPDSSVRWVEFEMYAWQMHCDDGMSLGTSASHTFHNYDLQNFDWAPSASTGNYSAYNYHSNDTETWLGGVQPGVNNCWHTNCSYLTGNYTLYGGDCNVGGDPSDPYVGIEYLHITIEGQPYPMLDELAVVVY